jgi:hypothetical protein
MKLILATFTLIVIASAAFAVEPIEGAFGIKLGDAFDPAKAISRASMTDGTPMYQFRPEKPFRSFSKYYVLVTPSTHKVYCIWGIGRVENTETGKKEQAIVMQAIEEKYGPQDNAGLMDGFYDSQHITQGSKMVMTKITGFMDTTIEIRYYDNELEKVAEQERLAIEGKKVDKTGL